MAPTPTTSPAAPITSSTEMACSTPSSSRPPGPPSFPPTMSAPINSFSSAMLARLCFPTSSRVFMASHESHALPSQPYASSPVKSTPTRVSAWQTSALPSSATPSTPYAVHVSPNLGSVTNFNGKLKLEMTAHPKRDPRTGECFAFRWFWLPPFLTYFRFDKPGRKTGPDVPIHSICSPTLLHDFALTERYVIFPDIQIAMKPLDMLLGRGAIVGAEPKKLTRLGVLPRYVGTEGEAVRWFNVPGFIILHVINSWEKGDTIVIIGPTMKPIEHFFIENLDLMTTYMEMVWIDLISGLVTRTVLTEGKLDLGVINPNFVGQRNRYVYMAEGCPFPKIGGLVKLDFEQVGNGYDCVVARMDFGPGKFAGEPFFVGDGGEGEDDEYLVTYLYDEGVDQSSFVVMEAQSLELVADVKLPQRVPYGFHGLFVTLAELQRQ